MTPLIDSSHASPDVAKPLPHGLTVVVPVYNSATTLPVLLERLEPVLKELHVPFEVIMVNDGSRDESWNVVCQLASERPWLRGLGMMRNYGQHNALLAGLRCARYALTATLDDDLQHPPEELDKLVAELQRGYDVVYGTPQKQQHGLWRNMASQVTKLTLQGMMGATNARNVSAFRVFRTRLREAFSTYRSPSVSLDVLLTWGTSRFSAVQVRHEIRHAGASNYTFRQLVRHALNMMTGFSALPLRVASLIGISFTILGLILLVYVLGRYLLEGDSVPGFPFLASTIAIFSGAQMFALGIIGEYLARMHFRSLEKPTYVLLEDTANEAAKS